MKTFPSPFYIQDQVSACEKFQGSKTPFQRVSSTVTQKGLPQTEFHQQRERPTANSWVSLCLVSPRYGAGSCTVWIIIVFPNFSFFPKSQWEPVGLITTLFIKNRSISIFFCIHYLVWSWAFCVTEQTESREFFFSFGFSPHCLSS